MGYISPKGSEWKKWDLHVHTPSLQKVLLNTTYMYSAIRGIAGNAVGLIQALELPAPDNNRIDNSL